MTANWDHARSGQAGGYACRVDGGDEILGASTTQHVLVSGLIPGAEFARYDWDNWQRHRLVSNQVSANLPHFILPGASTAWFNRTIARPT